MGTLLGFQPPKDSGPPATKTVSVDVKRREVTTEMWVTWEGFKKGAQADVQATNAPKSKR
jgi:hypothetical protein